MLTVPVSIGELIDKITILEIKSQRITDKLKLENVERELNALHGICEVEQLYIPELEDVVQELKSVNEQLWDIEDQIRLKEESQDFGEDFIKLARSVYITNDKRALLKREINQITGSPLVEEKSYKG